MVRTRMALKLYVRIVAHGAARHTLSKACFETSECMVQIQLTVEVLFTQDSDLFYAAHSSLKLSLFFSSYLFGLGFNPVQDDFQHDFARITD